MICSKKWIILFYWSDTIQCKPPSYCLEKWSRFCTWFSFSRIRSVSATKSLIVFLFFSSKFLFDFSVQTILLHFPSSLTLPFNPPPPLFVVQRENKSIQINTTLPWQCNNVTWNSGDPICSGIPSQTTQYIGDAVYTGMLPTVRCNRRQQR